MNVKEACQKIRYICKRGSNEMLRKTVEEVFLAGMDAGAKALAEQLKGRLNDHQQSPNTSSDSSGERGESDSPEFSESRGPDAADTDRA